jgi:hypothetical protein
LIQGLAITVTEKATHGKREVKRTLVIVFLIKNMYPATHSNMQPNKESVMGLLEDIFYLPGLATEERVLGHRSKDPS